MGNEETPYMDQGQGPSQTSVQQTKRRSTASSSSSSSTSTSSSSTRSRKHKHHRQKKRGGKRSHHSNRKLDELTKQVADLREQLATVNNGYISDASRNLYHECNVHSPENVPTHYVADQSLFNFDVATKLKEPSVPKTSTEHLKELQEVQLFDNSNWCELRYADTQKLYNHSPGFVELEANEEIKAYDTLRNLSYSDKAYAALTFCFLKQRSSLETTLRELLSWAQGQQAVTFEFLTEKVNSLFSEGDFQKTSADLLQLICGHRAEVLQMRRDGIINRVRDPLMKSTLRKIPPSCKNLFSAEALTTAIEKAGGVRKVFWPVEKRHTTTKMSASQAGTKTNSFPSQGRAQYNQPPQGSNWNAYPHGNNVPHVPCCSRPMPPSQGVCNHNVPSQGYNHTHAATTSHNNDFFRTRNPRQKQRQQESYYTHSRKRASTPPKFRGNKKRKY